MNLTIRYATIEDIPTILRFIIALAQYERLEHEVIATEQQLRSSLFGVKPQAEVLLAIQENSPVGFALFFSNFSTFIGKSGIHLEDLFVLPENRGQGIGKQLLLEVQSIASERGAGRLEWNVLDWNMPAIEFYQSMGAKPVPDWITYRMTELQLSSSGDNNA